MAIIVQKFGGTSVANINRIFEATNYVKKELDLGNQVIVVVSAMAGVTQQLIGYCSELSSLTFEPSLAEYDTAVSSGETTSSALFALALQQQGINSISLLAWQIPIITDDNHSQALITKIEGNKLKALLDKNIVPIIPGFQGINSNDRITTLGRGGSDITAVAIASVMKAYKCDIYTDVDGVFHTDPRIVPNTKKLKYVTYEEMLEFAELGAKVIHPRAVQIAMRYEIPVNIISSFNHLSGTTIQKIENKMEKPKITGITFNKNVALITLVSKKPFSAILDKVLESDIVIEHVVHVHQNEAQILVSLLNLSKNESQLKKLIAKDILLEYQVDNSIAILSVIGCSIKNDQKTMQVIVKNLKLYKTDIFSIITSCTKISAIINEHSVEKIISSLHDMLIQNDKKP